MGSLNLKKTHEESSHHTPMEAPWVGRKPTSATLWVTAQAWVDKNHGEILQAMSGLVSRGAFQEEDVRSDALLLAFETLKKCVSVGRLDTFQPMFFSGLKFKILDHFRHEKPLFSIRFEDPDLRRKGLPAEFRDHQPSPEDQLVLSQEIQDESHVVTDILTRKFHPRSCARLADLGTDEYGSDSLKRLSQGYFEAFSAMTRQQRKYWSGILNGEKSTLSAKAEMLVIQRSLQKVKQNLPKAVALGLFFAVASLTVPSQGWAERQIVQQPYTHEDLSGAIKFPANVPTFVLTETLGRKGVTTLSDSSKNPQFFGQKVSASGIDPDLLAKIGAAAAKEVGSGQGVQVKSASIKDCAPSPVYFPLAQTKPLPGEVSELLTEVEPCGRVPFRIVGHACDLGTAGYNQRLSERRATQIAEILKKQGYAVEHVEGVGESSPATSDLTHRNLNRRVEIFPARKDVQ